MFATEFNMDEAVKVWKEEAREEGLEEGREEGRLVMLKNFLENGGTVVQAKELLKATEEEIQKATKEM